MIDESSIGRSPFAPGNSYRFVKAVNPLSTARRTEP